MPNSPTDYTPSGFDLESVDLNSPTPVSYGVPQGDHDWRDEIQNPEPVPVPPLEDEREAIKAALNELEIQITMGVVSNEVDRFAESLGAIQANMRAFVRGSKSPTHQMARQVGNRFHKQEKSALFEKLKKEVYKKNNTENALRAIHDFKRSIGIPSRLEDMLSDEMKTDRRASLGSAHQFPEGLAEVPGFGNSSLFGRESAPSSLDVPVEFDFMGGPQVGKDFLPGATTKESPTKRETTVDHAKDEILEALLSIQGAGVSAEAMKQSLKQIEKNLKVLVAGGSQDASKRVVRGLKNTFIKQDKVKKFKALKKAVLVHLKDGHRNFEQVEDALEDFSKSIAPNRNRFGL